MNKKTAEAAFTSPESAFIAREEHTPRTDAEIRAELDRMLDEAYSEMIADRPSLAALLGQYEPLKGHHGFYGRAPKLRQQIGLAEVGEKQAADTDEATIGKNMRSSVEYAQFAVYKCIDGEMKQADTEEMLDEFTAEEIVDLMERFLGMKVRNAEDTTDPNAPT